MPELLLSEFLSDSEETFQSLKASSQAKSITIRMIYNKTHQQAELSFQTGISR